MRLGADGICGNDVRSTGFHGQRDSFGAFDHPDVRHDYFSSFFMRIASAEHSWAQMPQPLQKS